MSGGSILSASGLSASYASQNVLHDLEFDLGAAEICGIIGPNGAGKTTLLRCLYGLLRPRSGQISFNGEDITETGIRGRIERQVSYVPQERSVFPNLTVNENLELATDALPASRQSHRRTQMELIFDLFPRLKERKVQLAGTMSGGEQRMVAISIGLMSQPRVLMLDEPTTGLAPQVVHSLMDVINRLNRDFGIATIIVEQNILSTAKIADRIYIIKDGHGSNFGGSPRELTKRQILEYL